MSPRATGPIQRPGAKPLYTEELKDSFLEAIMAGLTERDACWANGFSEDTLTRWKRGEAGAPEDFPDQLRQAKAKRVLQWFNIVRRKAAGRRNAKTGKWETEPHLGAALELIDRCAPEYRKNPRMEVSGPGGAPIAPPPSIMASLKIDALSPQEQFVFAQLLEKLAGNDVLDAEVIPIESGPKDD